MSISVVNTLPEEKWRRFVVEHPAGNIFHTPEMFRVFEQAEKHQPSLWAAVDSDERILAIMIPVEVTTMTGLLHQLATRAVVYGGILCAPGSEGKKALERVLQTYKQKIKGKFLFTELRNLSNLEELQPILTKSGFIYEEHLNFLIDLQRPVEEIWKSVRSNVRTNVRKARKKGVDIEEITSIEEIQTAYPILAEVYNRNRIPLAPLSLFESAHEVLYPQDMIRCFAAKVENTYIGFAVRLIFKKDIYAWYVGTLKEYASYKPNDLLNWHVLEWGAQNGYHVFDFGGAGKPDEDYGPRKFKAKFGGDLVNFGRNICIHAPLRLKFSKAGYDFLRRFSILKM